MSLVLALALAHANSVEMDGWRWRALIEPEVSVEEPPGPQVLSRDVRIDPRSDEVRFEASWRIRSAGRHWFEARIAGPGVQIAEASFRGKELAITEADDGTRVAIELEGEGVLVVRGVTEGVATRDTVVLDLLPAAVGRVRVQTASRPIVTAAGPVISLGDGIWTGAAGLAVRLTDRSPPAPRPDLAIATAAVGLTIGEGSYDARGRVRWEVRHGELSTVVLDATGAGADLDVKGPTVASWRRSGDRVTVELLQPEDRLVELELTWSGAVPQGDEASLPLPSLRPQGAFKTESSVQLARDGEIELVPRLESWTAVSFADLPEWGRGLVSGTATSTYRTAGNPGGQVGLFRFTPVSGPPTFVDTATITAATTSDGNVLMRAHYAVRNDRSAHLRVTPPEGAVVVGARVAGETARVAMDGRTWLIPLGKSVETVEGLLAFPVEVVLLLPGASWDLRERRSLPVPQVDAPVAVTRATLYLPPGYRSELEDGDGDVVGSFIQGEGIAYGQGTGSSAQAEALMQEAVQAWMSNDFQNAEGLLRQLEDVGGFDENAQRLQSNLDVISGKGSGQYDVAMERRVKEQAKARSLSDQEEQEKALEAAESSYLSGDYAHAEVAYKKALEIGEKLGKLEQDESVEQEVRNVALNSRLEETKEEAVKKAKQQVAFKEADARRKSEEEASRKQDESERYRAEAAAAERAAAEAAAAVSGDDRRVTITNDQIVITEEIPVTGTRSGDVITRDFFEKIPAGRSYQSVLDSADAQSEVANQPAQPVQMAPPATVSIDGRADNTNVYDFEDLDIEGELMLPQGNYTIGGEDGFDDTGVAGGVEGGVVGGVVGGVMRGASGAAAPDEPEPMPDIDYDGVVDSSDREIMVVQSKRAPGIKLPSIQIGKGKNKDASDGPVLDPEPPPPPEESEESEIEISFGRDRPIERPDTKPSPEKPAVTAVQLTAVIPSQGAVVHYEHLLLESDATYALPIDAKIRRRDR